MRLYKSRIKVKTLNELYRKMSSQNKPSSQIKPPFFHAVKHQNYPAIIDESNVYISFRDILAKSKSLSNEILTHMDKNNMKGNILSESRIGFISCNSAFYTICQWATWMCGGVAVPLCKTHPESEIQYTLEDAECSLLITDNNHFKKLSNVNDKLKQKLPMINYNQYENQDCSNIENDLNNLNKIWSEVDCAARNAMLIYTSGTTGRPKGAVWTFQGIETQLRIMSDSWKISRNDGFLHVLPLHHVHGVMNGLLLPLVNGAQVKMLSNFNAEKVSSYFKS